MKPTSATRQQERLALQELDDSWHVHRALIMAELRNPGLANNPRWKLHRMDAYEDFHNMLTRSRNGL